MNPLRIIAIFGFFLAGCADDHANMDDPACFYATLGAMTVIATDGMSTEATAEVHFMEHGHKVQLEAGNPKYVWINVPEAGEAGIYIQSEGAVEAFYHEGVEVDLGIPSNHPDCDSTFPVFYDVANMAAGTWHIKLNAVTEASEVWIMAIPKSSSSSHSGHAHHHH